jgi:polyphosphate kinase
MAKKGAERRKKGTVTSEAEALPVNEQVGLKRKEYRKLLGELQIWLFDLQQWITAEGQRLVIVLDGLGPSGKRGTARRIAEGLDQRICKIVALDPPTKRERGQWHFQRYVEHFPISGRMAIFDGSWYHEPAIERALGLSTEVEFADFLNSCIDFEQMLARSGISLVKYWLTADDEEQDLRFRAHVADVLKRDKSRWALQSAVNEKQTVSDVRQTIIQSTHTGHAPWYTIQNNDRRQLRLDCISHLIRLVPKQGGAEPESSFMLPVSGESE